MRIRRQVRPLFCALLAGLAAPAFLHAANSICAVVKLQISQEATLEREAFNAHLKINNTLSDTPLTNLGVQIIITDADGNPADHLFFVKLSRLVNTNAVDGTGVIQPASSAEIGWLIIPTTGAGGASPLGKKYGVKAAIDALSGTDPQTLTTFDAFITVKPQPVIRLEYVLPYEVFADEPLTEEIEPVEPFPLGVRVSNVGHGAARNFKIESAQPKIVENKQGLLVDFKIVSTSVDGKAAPNTLLIPFGDIPADRSSLGSWIMTSSLSGRFVEFTSSFTHAAELGGQLTSLIQEAVTRTLVREVIVDGPDRDSKFDFLISTSADRALLQDHLDSGHPLMADAVLESGSAGLTPIATADSALSGVLEGPSSVLSLSLSTPLAPGQWFHTAVPFPYGERFKIISVIRSDGKILNPKNFWISKHFRKSDLSRIYHLNVLDSGSGAARYTLHFDPAQTDLGPGAVTDLAASALGSSGGISIQWTAPGEDGYLGSILGGRYLVQAETDPDAVFSSTLATVNVSTTTLPGLREGLFLPGLPGNATYYIHLWTLDTGGSVSAISNRTATHVPPAPPASVSVDSVSWHSAKISWTEGNNQKPVEYRVILSTSAFPLVVSAASPFSPGAGSFVFDGLASNVSYYVFGESRNPDTLANSETFLLASFATLPSDVLPPRTAISAGNPQAASSGTLYVSELTTFTLTAQDDHSQAGDGAGMGVDRTFYALDGGTFTVYSGAFRLAEGGPHTVLYYSVDIMGNTETVQSFLVTTDTGFPLIEIASPLPVLYSSGTIPVAFSVTDHFDPAPSSSAFLAMGSRVIAVANGTVLDSGLLEPGIWRLEVQAQDFLGHGSTNSVSFEVKPDTTAPTVVLFSSGPRFEASSATYVSEQTVISLAAQGESSAVQIFYAVDASTFAVYAGTFTLPEGIRTIKFYSFDPAGNFSSTQIVVLNVDATAPETFVLVEGAGSAVVRIVSSDPLSNGVVSGVQTAKVKVDTGSFTDVPSTYDLTLGHGSHQVSMFAVDNVDHAGIVLSTSVFVDAIAPQAVTDLAAQFDSSATAVLSWTAPFDEGFSGGASSYDLRFATVPIDESSFASLAFIQAPIPGAVGFKEFLPVTGLGPGATYYFALKSFDAAGNVSPISNVAMISTRAPEVVVDTVPPVSVLSLTGPRFTSGDVTYIASHTVVGLSSTDDMGPAALFYSVDSSTFAVYAGTFTLPEGLRTVQFYGEDGAGNQSSTQTLALSVDTTPPETFLSVLGAEVTLGAGDPVSNGVASGVQSARISVDTDTFILVPPTHSVILGHGFHQIRAFSVDNVENAGAVSSTSVFVDALAPAAVTDLSALALSSASIVLSWTAPSDAGPAGNAAGYDIRYGTSPMDETGFFSAPVLATPAPSPAGTAEHLAVEGLSPENTYYFALKSFDTAGNTSSISNVASAVTFPRPGPSDITPPQIVILAPAPGTVLLGAALISGTASDNAAVASVEVRIGTRAFALAAGTAAWVFNLDVSGLERGTHTITARATDLSGNAGTASVAVGIASNLAFNPGFEEGEKGWYFPPSASIDNKVFHSGQKSAKLTRRFRGRSYIASAGIPVSSGTVYHVSVWVKREEIEFPGHDSKGKKKDGSAGPKNGARALVQWHDSKGRKLRHSAVAFEILDTADWTLFERKVVAPNRAAWARIKLSMNGAKGTVWFDDVLFHEVPGFGALALGSPSFDAEALESEIEDDDAQDTDEEPLAAPPADPSFRLGEFYSYPNPAVGSQQPTLHLECGIADSVELRIYDVTGAPVHEVRMDGTPPIMNGKYAYEYAWDASGVASGVYIWVAVAKKQGERDIRVIKKLAVIR